MIGHEVWCRMPGKLEAPLPPQNVAQDRDGSIWYMWRTEIAMEPAVQEHFDMHFQSDRPSTLARAAATRLRNNVTMASDLRAMTSLTFRSGADAPVDVDRALHDAYVKWSLDVPDDPFVAAYRDYASDALDNRAPVQYQDAMALMLLSLVYGDKVYVVTGIGPVRCNLYMLLLGESTTTYKTRTMQLMLDTLFATGALTKSAPVLKFSKATDEFLYETALTAGPHMSLFYADEADGTIKQFYAKNYMAGTPELLTDVYTSNAISVKGTVKSLVRKRELQEKQNTEDGLTEAEEQELRDEHQFMLSILWGGTPDAVYQALTKSMFDSGLLARFSFVKADPLPRDETFAFLTQPNDGVEMLGEKVLRGKTVRFVKANLEQRVMAWKEETESEMFRMPFSDEAMEYMNRWDNAMFPLFVGRWSALEKSRSRNNMVALKLATLIAAGEGCHMIEVEHMRSAIKYATSMLMNVFDVYQNVSSSAFGRMQAEVLEVIAKNPDGISKKSLAQRFKDWRDRDLSEVMKVLTQNQLKVKVVARGGDLVYVMADSKEATL